MVGQKESVAIKGQSEFREDFKDPRMYRVHVLNDDFTTFQFVVYVLAEIFAKTNQEGWEIARTTHRCGKGLIGIYTYDLAKTKVEQAKALSRSRGFPLNFIITPES